MFTRSPRPAESQRRLRWLTAALLVVWAAASFGVSFFARTLNFIWGDWPFSFWVTAQGCVLVFLAITVVYAVVANRLDPASNVQDIFRDDERPPESREPPAKRDR
jgi:putative solute:sodium symporter small subunit